ncbi:hypothetical protein RhiirB3_401226 [Rhizophagus irregularis]|uniref:Uncharacterized protein n=1 Tax=Rhizophagus irregularis TaxID=588596 RepID=A0A2I1DZ48_9GLOM|nr:hypothetical protein RhiirC2_728325 [Rhizophagus irregularis]PKY15151.1 hypothetical protein RhiirB3_401226 [Rhizophagus irregularis]
MVNLYEGKFELRPEKYITGPNGHELETYSKPQKLVYLVHGITSALFPFYLLI